MRKILTALVLLLNMTAMAQIQPVREKPVPIADLTDYEVSKDAKNGEVVLKGTISFKDMQKEPSFGWLQKGIYDYQPKEKAMKYLNKYLKDYDLLVFMGTWCEDSQNLIPKYFKVLFSLEHPILNNMIIGVDREKTTKIKYMPLVKDNGITLVPTIILMSKDGKEAGRIIEAVDKSVEEDMMAIIKKDRK